MAGSTPFNAGTITMQRFMPVTTTGNNTCTLAYPRSASFTTGGTEAGLHILSATFHQDVCVYCTRSLFILLFSFLTALVFYPVTSSPYLLLFKDYATRS